MPFPDVERVVYGRNPLDRVICQFRFPAILKIDSEVPSDFQEAIRQQFPIYNEKSEVTVEIPQELRDQLPSQLPAQIISAVGPRKNHEFISEDGKWTVNVTRTFLALSTSDYQEWKDFRDKVEIPFEALRAVYSPPFFSRIGLRYIDVIKRSAYGIAGASWDSLLQPYITGFLASPHIVEDVRSFENRSVVQLSDEESVVSVTTKFVESEDDEETNFMIDSDFFHRARSPVPEAINKLDFFHVQATRLFRWCITDDLHHAMESFRP